MTIPSCWPSMDVVATVLLDIDFFYHRNPLRGRFFYQEWATSLIYRNTNMERPYIVGMVIRCPHGETFMWGRACKERVRISIIFIVKSGRTQTVQGIRRRREHVPHIVWNGMNLFFVPRMPSTALKNSINRSREFTSKTTHNDDQKRHDKELNSAKAKNKFDQAGSFMICSFVSYRLAFPKVPCLPICILFLFRAITQNYSL